MRAMIAAGRIPRRNAAGPAVVVAADVDRVRSQRRAEAMRRHPDTAAFAQEIRRILWPMTDLPDDTVELADGRVEPRNTVPWSLNTPMSGTRALAFLPADAAAVFGPDVLQAAAAPARAFSGVCRTCFADAAARIHETLRPEDSPAYRALLGTPCATCRARFAAEAIAVRAELSRLKARVDAGTRTAAKERAQVEFNAATTAQTAASRRVSAAADALGRAGVRTALTASATPLKRSRLDCACTSETVCADHARQLARRGRR